MHSIFVLLITFIKGLNAFIAQNMGYIRKELDNMYTSDKGGSYTLTSSGKYWSFVAWGVMRMWRLCTSKYIRIQGRNSNKISNESVSEIFKADEFLRSEAVVKSRNIEEWPLEPSSYAVSTHV